MPIVVPSDSGQMACQFSAWRSFRMPYPCVSNPYPAISAAVWTGVMTCSQTPDTTSPIANPENPLTKPPAKAAKQKSSRNSPSIGRSPKAYFSSTRLLRFSVGDLIEQHHAVGLSPQPDLAGIGEGGIFDLEQLFAIEGHAEARAAEVDAQAVPGVGRNLDVDSVASLAADNVERASHAVDGLVENDVVLEGV